MTACLQKKTVANRMARDRFCFLQRSVKRLLLHFVLRVDDVFVLLRLAGRSAIGLCLGGGTRSAGRRAGLGTGSFVDFFAEFLRSSLQGFERLLDAIAVFALQSVAEIVQGRLDSAANFGRSEEHTSELQSQFHLVCRLLLEKKK